jgi:serine protease Do
VLVLVVVAMGLLAVLVGPELAGRFAYAITSQEAQALRDRLPELAKADTVSPLFRAVAKAVQPAVVEVRVSKKMQVEPMPDMDEFFRRFFGEEGAPAPGRRIPQPRREFFSRGLGSGVIVDAQNGYVLTNYHVVSGADTVEVILADGRKLQTEWVRGDASTDLAVVKINPDRLLAAPLGDSDKLEVGDWVLAIGSPEGLPQTVTSGIVSAKGRSRPELRATHLYQDFIQTDAAINHGNSGGPLVNMLGEVVGVNTAIVSRTGVNEGIGLSIPSNMAKVVMRQLIDRGKVVRGYLGVRFQDVDERLVKSFKLPNTSGALVAQVAPGGPAQKAGLQAGDFITGINGKSIQDGNDLRNVVAALPLDKPAKFEVYRDGKKIELDVTIAEQPDDMAAAFGETPRGEATTGPGAPVAKLGLKVVTLDEALAKRLGIKQGTRGVAITDVADGSDAQDQGLEAGMVITEVDGTAVASADEFAKSVEGKDMVRLKVLTPGGGTQYVAVSPAAPTTRPKQP